MSDEPRYVRYMPNGQIFDLAELTAAEYRILVSLRGEIARGDNVLECLQPGGDPWLTVYRHESGNHYARHFPGGAHGSHKLVRKPDRHLRVQDYIENGYSSEGITSAQEVSTNNGTRIDVATLTAPRISGIEVHFGDDRVSVIRTRTTRSLRATAFKGRHARPLPDGVLPVWFSPDDYRRQWLYLGGPTIEAPTMSWDFVPKHHTVNAIGVRQIEPERCTPASRWQGHCPRTGRGSCQDTHPFAALRTGLTVDAVAAMVAIGQLVPLRYFTGAIYLVDLASFALYAELGGDGVFAAGMPRAVNPARLLGPCRNIKHGTESSPPGTASGGRSERQDSWPAAPQLPDAPRCRSCGSPDHFASAHRSDVSPVRATEPPPRQSSRSRPTGRGLCAGGCGAQPPGGAEYCQGCRLVRLTTGAK